MSCVRSLQVLAERSRQEGLCERHHDMIPTATRANFLPYEKWPRAELFACIRRIHAEQVTILLVEQNVHQALDIADRAYVLENGRTVRTGTAAELLADDAIQTAYLGL